jgi:hypothetical protein
MPAPPLAPRPNRLGLGPERGGLLAAAEFVEETGVVFADFLLIRMVRR